MKIEVNKNELQHAVNQAIMFLNSNNTYITPLLDSIKFYFTGHSLLVQTVCLEGNFTKTVSVKAFDPESLYFVIDKKEISKVLSHIKTNTIILENINQDQISITYGKNTFKVLTHIEDVKDAANELPSLINGDKKRSDTYMGVIHTLEGLLENQFNDKSKVIVSYDFDFNLEIKKQIKGKLIPEFEEYSYLPALEKLNLLTSNDPVKPAYTVINVINVKNKLAFEATDGKFLGRLITNIDTDIKESFLLPKPLINFIVKYKIGKSNLKILSYKLNDIITPKMFYLTTDDMTIQIKVLEGKFPNADNVIPNEFYCKFDVMWETNNKAFTNLLNEIVDNTGETTTIRFNLNEPVNYNADTHIPSNGRFIGGKNTS